MKKVCAVLALTLAAFPALTAAATASPAETLAAARPGVSEPVPAADIVEVTPENWQDIMNQSRDKMVFLTIGAEWCGICHQLQDDFGELLPESDGKWLVGRIDYDEHRELASEVVPSDQGLSVPGTSAFRDGERVDESYMSGYSGKIEDLREYVNGQLG